MPSKVLLVEDSEDKAAAIRRALAAHGVHDASITRATNATQARQWLAENRADLLILDVVIPNRSADTPNPESGLTLLRELCESAYLRRPRYVVGVTAFQDVAAEHSSEFEALVWTLLHYDPNSTTWSDRLSALIRYIQKVDAESKSLSYQTDLCVVTALREPEFRQLIRLPWNWKDPEPLDDYTFFRRGAVHSNSRKFSVIAAHCSRMGMVPAGLLTMKLIERFRPRVLAMVGICAGIRGKVSLGDLVVALQSWDWQSGKYVKRDGASTFQYDPDQISCSRELASRLELLDDTDICEIAANWPGPRPTTQPKLHLGPMASGSAVLSDGGIVEKIVAQNRKVLAVDMECYGLYSASVQCGAPSPLHVCVKGVCDFGDDTKSDDAQAYSAYLAAEALRVAVERFGHEIFALR